MLVDSHCHLNMLDLSKRANGLDDVIENAHQHGVTHMLCVAVTLDDVPDIMRIASTYKNIRISVGLHPNEHVKQEPTADTLIDLSASHWVVAIGETGLDYYRSEGDLTWQQERFRTHIHAAKSVQKPLIIHTRDARDDTIRIMQEEKANEARGVLHCFTETWEMAKQALDLDFYISFSGIVTFKNATELQDVAKRLPLDRILVETDSPYLAPVPYRGKPNEPAYVKYVAEFLAQLRNEPIEKILEQTSQNYFNLFAISR